MLKRARIGLRRGATRYLCSAKRRCIVYVVMFCASRDRESWQGVASLRGATRKGVEQLTRKSFSIRFSRALPILLIVCDRQASRNLV